MRPTLNLLSKASRLPLNSKKANKDFYKGTGTGNILVRKRIAVANRRSGEPILDEYGRVKTWNLKVNRLDESRITSYVVPPGLYDTDLQPLVYRGAKEDGGIQGKPLPGYPGAPKMKPTVGMDGEVYEHLATEVRQRKLGTD